MSASCNSYNLPLKTCTYKSVSLISPSLKNTNTLSLLLDFSVLWMAWPFQRTMVTWNTSRYSSKCRNLI